MDKETFMYHYNNGKNDAEIAKAMNIHSRETVRQFRIKLGLNKNFSYTSRRLITKDQLEPLILQEKTDDEVAKILNVSKSTVYFWRKKHNINRRSLILAKEKPLTEFQKSVLFGTLLGDSSLVKSNINPSFKCKHGPSQKEYCEHKYEVFKSIGAKFFHSKRNTADKRNGKFY